jgi:FtsH-binding integral membrane protein
MSSRESSFQTLDARTAADSAESERVAFLQRTYAHVFGAVVAFTLIEWLLFRSGVAETLTGLAFSGRWSWLIFLGGFLLVSKLAEKWATSEASAASQYLGLGLYTAAEAVIFAPLLFYALRVGGPEVIQTAAVATLTLFGALTMIVLFTRQDFSFLRTALWLGSIAALGFIVLGIFLGFMGGNILTIFMIILMTGWILYHTSEILHRYPTTHHVAAALALFASLATLFWYVLRLVMALRSR